MAVADDVLRVAARWSTEGPVALATVTATTGSAPRRPGATMVVAAGGRVAGSVSSGCVESAVFELAQQVLATGAPVVETFGYSDDDTFAIGLTCGGTVEVFVQRLDAAAELGRLHDTVGSGEPVAVATVLEHPDTELIGTRLVVGHETGASDALPPSLDASLRGRAAAMLHHGSTGQVYCGPDGSPVGEGVRAFVQAWVPPPRLLLFGAVDFSAALAGAGRFLGYEVVVCDPRSTFASAKRFPDAHHVVHEWPHVFLDREIADGRVDARTAICVLTHDSRFDVPVLERALRLTEVGFVGAMGSRRTHDDRLDRLRAAGLSDAQLARLRSPIGLDVGGVTPEETALSIAAEIVADRRGGTGARLSEVDGPIHGAGDDVVEPRTIASA